MMYFLIHTNDLSQTGTELESLIANIESCAKDVSDVGMKLRLKDLVSEILSLKIRRQANNIRGLSKTIREYENALKDIIDSFEKNEKSLNEEFIESRKGVIRRENLTGQSGVFDDKGKYGGDQGDMKNNQAKTPFLFWWFGGNSSLYAAVRSYPQYSNYTDEQIDQLYKQIDSESCGYVSMVNTIFVQYNDDSERFERDFGFPMYDEKGEYNYNRLLLDIYAETDDKFFLDEEYGATALTTEIMQSYKDHEEDFQKEYGVSLYQDGNKERFNPAGQQAILDRYGKESVVSQKTSGVNVYSYENRMQHYLKERNVPVSSHSEQLPSNRETEMVNTYLQEGKSVTILDKNYNLYDEEGNVHHVNIGHAQTVTGVTSDGRFIVSSWGKKYYIKPDELNWKTIEVTDIYV